MKTKQIFLILSFFGFVTILFSQEISRIESVQSLYIETFRDNTPLGKATGFVIRSKTRNYLITNWHVVTNKHPSTKSWIDLNNAIEPNVIKILHNSTTLGEYVVKSERLILQNNFKSYFEYPIGNEMIDVVAIPLKDTLGGVKIYPVNYQITYDSLLLMPTDRIFILGFPLGVKSSPALPIWKSGLIASEPDVDQENKPIIWVDMFGIPGMSGSPVYYITDRLVYKNGNASQLIGGQASFFMGVFSHGNENIGIGALWKSTYLKKLFNALP